MNYTMQLTQQEIQIIIQGLGELPFKLALNVFGKVQQQIQEQDKQNAIPIENLNLSNSELN